MIEAVANNTPKLARQRKIHIDELESQLVGGWAETHSKWSLLHAEPPTDMTAVEPASTPARRA